MCFLSLPAFASYDYSGADKPYSGSVGLGYLAHNAGVAATDASSGAKPFLSDTYTQFNISGRFTVAEAWSISPLLMLTYPAKKTAENMETTALTYFTVRGMRDFGMGFDGHFGLGVLYYELKGSGGTIQLQNGSGTATFGIPSQTRSSSLLAWDFGGGYHYQIYRVDLSLVYTSIFSSTRRALTPILNFSLEVL